MDKIIIYSSRRKENNVKVMILEDKRNDWYNSIQKDHLAIESRYSAIMIVSFSPTKLMRTAKSEEKNVKGIAWRVNIHTIKQISTI